MASLVNSELSIPGLNGQDRMNEEMIDGDGFNEEKTGEERTGEQVLGQEIKEGEGMREGMGDMEGHTIVQDHFQFALALSSRPFSIHK